MRARSKASWLSTLRGVADPLVPLLQNQRKGARRRMSATILLASRSWPATMSLPSSPPPCGCLRAVADKALGRTRPHCATPAMHCAHTVVSHEACGDLDPSVCQIYNPNKPSYCFMNKGKQCDRAYAANGEVEDTPHPSHYHPKTRLTQPEAPKVSIPRPHTAQTHGG